MDYSCGQRASDSNRRALGELDGEVHNEQQHDAIDIVERFGFQKMWCWGA
jgi:hypothetical protein